MQPQCSMAANDNIIATSSEQIPPSSIIQTLDTECETLELSDLPLDIPLDIREEFERGRRLLIDAAGRPACRRLRLRPEDFTRLTKETTAHQPARWVISRSDEKQVYVDEINLNGFKGFDASIGTHVDSCGRRFGKVICKKFEPRIFARPGICTLAVRDGFQVNLFFRFPLRL